MREAPEYAWEKDKQRRDNLAMMQSGCNLRCNPFEPEALSGDEDKNKRRFIDESVHRITWIELMHSMGRSIVWHTAPKSAP